jgi:hypothetical protein
LPFEGGTRLISGSGQFAMPEKPRVLGRDAQSAVPPALHPKGRNKIAQQHCG